MWRALLIVTGDTHDNNALIFKATKHVNMYK